MLPEPDENCRRGKVEAARTEESSETEDEWFSEYSQTEFYSEYDETETETETIGTIPLVAVLTMGR